MVAMKRHGDKSFDLAVVDPPYGIGDFSQSDGACRGQIHWNNSIPDKAYFEELRRISKEQIIWGANYYNCFTGGAIVWDKMNMHPHMSRCEIASVSYGVRVAYFPFLHHGGAAKRNGNFHPCGKPIELYQWLFKNYAKEGDRIIDTHLGSGSSRIAAYDLGLDFCGYEVDKDYFTAQEKRFHAHAAQARLFQQELSK